MFVPIPASLRRLVRTDDDTLFARGPSTSVFLNLFLRLIFIVLFQALWKCDIYKLYYTCFNNEKLKSLFMMSDNLIWLRVRSAETFGTQEKLTTLVGYGN